MAQLDGIQQQMPAEAVDATTSDQRLLRPPPTLLMPPLVPVVPVASDPFASVQKAWPSADGWRQIRSGEIAGDSWGDSRYVLYEVCPRDLVNQDPYLFIWLHGQDATGTLTTSNMVNMQRKLRRRCFFLLPTNPKISADGYRFSWGVRATKAENKNDLGFVYGEMHAPYLLAVCKLVQTISKEVSAVANIVSGYSMGGFGAYQLAAFAPGVFTAVVTIAGYVIGTTETGGMYNAPQPHSFHRFSLFTNEYAPKLAKVPVIIAIHAVCDTQSSFRDTQELINIICGEGGDPSLVTLDEVAANSDAKKSKTGHAYFNHALLSPASEGVLYSKLRAGLDTAVAEGLGPNVVRPPPIHVPVPPPVHVVPQDVAPKAPVKLSLPSWTLEPSKPAVEEISKDKSHMTAAELLGQSASKNAAPNAPVKLSLASWTLGAPPKTDAAMVEIAKMKAKQKEAAEVVADSSSSSSASSSSSSSEAPQQKSKKRKKA